MHFRDRYQAGSLLGEAIAALEPDHPIVMALPRGGVPVGFEVARALECPLDVLLVRKIGVPGQPELAMGAVAEGGVVIRNHGVIELAGVSEGEFEDALTMAQKELDARVDRLRSSHPASDPSGHTVLVVDDGLATGATALAGMRAVSERGADSVWLCAPVAPPDTARAMAGEADRVVVLYVPDHFMAVGAWYDDFGQTSHGEVTDLLARSRLR